MKRFILSSLFAGLFCVTFVGCSQKSTVTKQEKIETPGGKTVIETKTDVTKTGDHKTDSPSTNP